MEYDVFISYNHETKSFVTILERYLKRKGLHVWRDNPSILGGDKIEESIKNGIAKSKALCIVISSAARNSEWVIGEFLEFRKYSKLDSRRRIVPVILNDVSCPLYLSMWKYIKINEEDYGEEQLMQIYEAVSSAECDDRVARQLDALLLSAKESITVFGHTLSKFSSVDLVNHAIREMLEKGINVTFILLNPYSDYTRAHEPFHLLESTKASFSQIDDAINFFDRLLKDVPKADLNVYLSNYMPRFRSILLDNRYCVINLYMYGNDVVNTPEIIFDKHNKLENSYFTSIQESVKSLLSSEHVIPIIKNGVFSMKNWKSIKYNDIIIHCLKTQCCRSVDNCCEEFQNMILCYQGSSRDSAVSNRLCDEKYKPGTFSINRIGPASLFLITRDFDKWLEDVVRNDLADIIKVKPELVIDKTKDGQRRIFEKVREILNFKKINGSGLKEQIYYQEYSDIIHRIIMMILAYNPDYEINLYPQLTAGVKSFILNVVDKLEKTADLSLKDWLFISIAAGAVGVDEKTVNAATSEIYRGFTIPMAYEGKTPDENAAHIANTLVEWIRTSPKIEAADFFFHILDSNATNTLHIASFPDDYIESVFLMKFYDMLLKEYDRVKISFIPKSIRCSNDLTCQDAEDLKEHFPKLKDSSHFDIIENGPKTGGVNILKLHEDVQKILKEALIVDVRGARNFEMMQGINKQTFFGFMVCRDFSISTVGLAPGETHPPLIYIHQAPKERSFEGFEDRHKRVENSYMLARKTVRDNETKWNGGSLHDIGSWPEQRKINFKCLRTYYSAEASDFDIRWGGSMEHNVSKLLNKIKGRVLVLGCGSGKEVAYLKSAGCDAYGIDISAEAVIIAKKKHGDIRDVFFIEDIYNIKNIMSGEFDGVVANASLVHLLDRNDLAEILKGIKQRLKTGGKFLIRMLKKYGRVEINIEKLNDIFTEHGVPDVIKNEILREEGGGKVSFNIVDLNNNLLLNSRAGVTNELMRILKENTSIIRSELDHEKRWFVYFSENELENLFYETGFSVDEKETEAHAKYPFVKWLTYLLINDKT